MIEIAIGIGCVIFIILYCDLIWKNRHLRELIKQKDEEIKNLEVPQYIPISEFD